MSNATPRLCVVFRHSADIVAAVLRGHTPEAAFARLDERLRAAVMEQVLGTLRDYGRGDFFLSSLLTRRFDARDEHRLRPLLLIALRRLENDAATAHTTVNEAVDAVADFRGGRYKGVVNGLLRNFLRQREVLRAAAANDPVASVRHPAWWSELLRAEHPTCWQRLLDEGNRHPPMSLRVNRRRTTKDDFLRRLAAHGIAAQALEDATIHLPEPLPVARLPGFAEGLCSVHDAGAQLAAPLLDVQPGMRVLDACAAPGGKSAHLLELADIDLLALDLDAQRARRISDNLARLGLTARVLDADARTPSGWWDGVGFERILADVPCSASGVVRRHPDAKWLRREDDIAQFACRQREIIDALWQTLKPGGKMLYATCSLFAAENQHQIAQFVARHADAVRLPTRWPGKAPMPGFSPPAAPPDATATEAFDDEIALLPNAFHDGFYYALLGKK